MRAESAAPVCTERIRLDRVLVDAQCAQWERFGSSLARYQSSAVAIGSSIYVTGGYYPDPTRPGTRLVSSALTCIDPDSGTLQDMGGMLCGPAVAIARSFRVMGRSS